MTVEALGKIMMVHSVCRYGPSGHKNPTWLYGHNLAKSGLVYYQTLTSDERDKLGGPPFAVLKFTCHNTANPTEEGFIWMYVQIPYDKTLRSSWEVRELQAEAAVCTKSTRQWLHLAKASVKQSQGFQAMGRIDKDQKHMSPTAIWTLQIIDLVY